MSRQQLFIAGIGLLAVAFLFIAVILYANKDKKNHKTSRSASGNEHGGRFFLVLYRVMSKWPLTSRSIYHIRSRIEIIGHTNERIVRIKVAKIYGLVLCALVVLFGVILTFNQEPLMIVLWIFVLWILSETLVDFFVVRLRNRLLWQQIKFNETVRHRYYQSKMVDEAIYETCMELDKNHYEVSLQGERMVDILMSKDPEQEMMAYNEVAPNKYLKMFLSLAYMTMEYGDAYKDDVSIFMKNLHDLTNEVRMELTKRERLNYALRSLNIIVLLPLLMLNPIQSWASNYFMPLKQFYESQSGFILEMVMIFMILICYVLLRRIQQFDKQQTSYSTKVALEDRMYGKGFKWIIDLIKPKRTKGSYLNLLLKLKRSRSNLSVEGFVMRQFICGLGVVILSISLILLLHYNTREQILTAPSIEQSFLGGQLSEAELEKANAITERDALYLSQINRHTTLEEIKELLIHNGFDVDSAEIVAKKLQDKQIVFYDQYLKLWEILLALFLGVIGYQIPRLFLAFRGRLLRMEVEDEVTGFSSIVLMLMHHERLSITDILEWFEMYAVSFTGPIGDCLNNISSGMTEALEELKDASDNEQYVRVIEGLILASKDITIRQAFDELETEKAFYMEKRKEQNSRLVEKKINMGNMIGFLPVYGLIALYMVVPMILIGINDMQKYFEQLNFN